MPTPVDQHLEALAAICRKYGIRRLELFGSAAQGRFNPATSDLDFLVEFIRTETTDLWEQWFGFHESLEALFNRKVDVVQESAITNPFFLKGVNRARILLFEEAP